jgi:hypothetical protein
VGTADAPQGDVDSLKYDQQGRSLLFTLHYLTYRGNISISVRKFQGHFYI